MKKLISIFMIVAVLASISAVNTSAAGQLLVEDTFSGSELDPTNWIVDGNEFFVEKGRCVGYKGAVVNQSYFYDEESRPDGNKQWNACSVSVDVMFYDYDNPDGNGANIWWADYVWNEDTAEYDQNTYTLEFKLSERQIWLNLTGDFDTVEEPVAIYDLPADYEIVVNEMNPSVINLGMRIQPNNIKCYLDGIEVINYNTTAPIGTQKGSPIILWNCGMYIAFDNFKVATVDYPLFASDLEPTPTPTDTTAAGTTAAPETSVQTSVNVVGTDADGKEVTEIVSQIVTVAPADTNTTGTAGGLGANTGDMAIIVVAVMVVALGTAIVVKKVNA